MSTHKSDKELAFLHDLYVATDWGERFAELVDEHVRLPKEGRALYVASGTGGHALALAGRAGRDVEMVCVDESEERLELARAKAATLKGAGVEFRHAQIEALARAGFEDEAAAVGALIEELPTVSDMEALARGEALEGVESWTRIEEFDFATGGEFLAAPLVRDFLLAHWLDTLPDEEAGAAVLREVERIIDEERHEGDFALSVKATIVVGRKAE